MNWMTERRRLYREHGWIAAVSFEAETLVEELRRRRDGESPQQLSLPNLRRAIDMAEAA